MAKYIFDESQAPIIIARFPVKASVEECTQYAVELSKILKKYDHIYYLVDATAVTPETAALECRKAMAESFNNIIDIFNKKVLARAHVIPNKITEGGFTTFLWFINTKLTSERRIFKDYDEAIAWLKSML